MNELDNMMTEVADSTRMHAGGRVHLQSMGRGGWEEALVVRKHGKY